MQLLSREHVCSSHSVLPKLLYGVVPMIFLYKLVPHDRIVKY